MALSFLDNHHLRLCGLKSFVHFKLRLSRQREARRLCISEGPRGSLKRLPDRLVVPRAVIVSDDYLFSQALTAGSFFELSRHQLVKVTLEAFTAITHRRTIPR